jgi:hypothetical protein
MYTRFLSQKRSSLHVSVIARRLGDKTAESCLSLVEPGRLRWRSFLSPETSMTRSFTVGGGDKLAVCRLHTLTSHRCHFDRVRITSCFVHCVDSRRTLHTAHARDVWTRPPDVFALAGH